MAGGGKLPLPQKLVNGRNEDHVAVFLRTSAGGVLIASRRGTARPLATAVPAASRAVVWAIERFGAPIPVWQCVLRRPIGYWRRTARGLRSGGIVMLALTLLLPAGVMESTAFLPRLLLLLAAPWPVILRRLLPALLVRTVPMVLRAGVVVDVSGGGVLLVFPPQLPVFPLAPHHPAGGAPVAAPVAARAHRPRSAEEEKREGGGRRT